MIKAVLFDVGGVLVQHDGLREAAFRAFRTEDRDTFWQLFNQAAMPASRGSETLADCWRTLAARLNVTVSEDVVQSLWIDDFVDGIAVDQRMCDLARQLAARYQVGIVSNSIAEHSRILDELGVYEPFDPVVLSHEVGIAKDDPAIFDIALERLGVRPSEALFIDDVETFARSAEKRGIRSLVFTSVEHLEEQLAGAGLEF